MLQDKVLDNHTLDRLKFLYFGAITLYLSHLLTPNYIKYKFFTFLIDIIILCKLSK